MRKQANITCLRKMRTALSLTLKNKFSALAHVSVIESKTCHKARRTKEPKETDLNFLSRNDFPNKRPHSPSSKYQKFRWRCDKRSKKGF